MLLLAKDGVYLPTAPRAITQGVLASGNRADVLINCPAGEFNFNSTQPKFPTDARFIQKEEDGPIEAVLLHITAVAPLSPPGSSPPPPPAVRPARVRSQPAVL